MARYSLIQIPGRSDLRIPVVDDTSSSDGGGALSGVQSPEWMVQIDSLLTSAVEGYTNYAQLFGWYGESSRYTSGDLSSSLFTSAMLRHSDLIIVIPNGGYAATIETLMNSGTPIQQLSIVRLGNINSQTVTLQTLKY